MDHCGHGYFRDHAGADRYNDRERCIVADQW
jgi:hypothetical protein